MLAERLSRPDEDASECRPVVRAEDEVESYSGRAVMEYKGVGAGAGASGLGAGTITRAFPVLAAAGKGSLGKIQGCPGAWTGACAGAGTDGLPLLYEILLSGVNCEAIWEVVCDDDNPLLLPPLLVQQVLPAARWTAGHKAAEIIPSVMASYKPLQFILPTTFVWTTSL
eukprot:CAMPEP_0171025710 /NCGR_PEP_ID=MMETSP0736-20130129/33811_1 /TAXON_ID=186038 /ORGANISM="Fragilariopsis kerguelensis, Strain L26-C5" /LENGTH=168 /DNA_ID=CAMNT_0011466031 /DNA_START=243 /DNA_END=749 /DNA_ORIENTATION=+